jgi:iron(III) transport system substrate-binding protein
VSWQTTLLVAALAVLLANGVRPGVTAGLQSQRQSPATVVVYSSEDRPCSESILKDFERDSGIQVVAVYDKEAAEHVMKRLIEERDDPHADVYWANEPVHPDQLKALGITQAYVSPNAADLPPMFKDPDGHWTAFSGRARVLVISSKVKPKPDSILAYANPRWNGKAVLADPSLNTTAFNLAALFNAWGDQRAWAFLERVKRNGVKISPGNGRSAVMVASGLAEFSLVDVDDGLGAVRENPTVELQYPDQGKNSLGSFIVANAVAMIRGAKHQDTARKLIDYLLTTESQRKLAFSSCAQTPLSRGVQVPSTVKRIEELRVMRVNYAEIRKKLEQIRPKLQAWAGRIPDTVEKKWQR